MADDILYRCAQAVLEVVVDALDTPPERQMVTDREPTDNCAHVAVWVTGPAHSVLGQARGRQQSGLPTQRTSVPWVTFTAQIMSTACYPVFDGKGKLPDPDDISAAAEAVLTDRMDAWEALREAAPTLFAGLLGHGRDGVEVAGPVAASPQSGGGLAGTRIDVRAELLRAPAAAS